MDYRCTVCGKPIGFEGTCYECRQEREMQKVLSMDDDAIQSVIKKTLANIDKAAEDYFEYYMRILCYRGVYSHEIAEAAIKADHDYPYQIYYKTSSDARDIILEKLMAVEADALRANGLMSAAAMQGLSRINI